jgi:hypothetical protein
MKLPEKGFEGRSECGFGRYIEAKTGRIVPLGCPWRPRLMHLRDFSDSFMAVDFSHLGETGIDTLLSPLHKELRSRCLPPADHGDRVRSSLHTTSLKTRHEHHPGYLGGLFASCGGKPTRKKSRGPLYDD